MNRSHLVYLYTGLMSLFVIISFTLKQIHLLPLKKDPLKPQLEMTGHFFHQPPFRTQKLYPYEISIAALIENEEETIEEWVLFHKQIGVSHFYLFNHFSNDRTLEILTPYIQENLIEVIDWPYAATDPQEWEEVKRSAYSFAVDKSRGQTKWLALLDIEDYLFPTNKRTILEVISSFEPFGGVVVNKLHFGSSDVLELPKDKLMIESLTWRASTGLSDNRSYQSIVRPERVATFISPSQIEYIPGYCQVTTNLTPFSGNLAPELALDQLRINHYFTKDMKSFINVKLEKRWSDQESIYDLLDRVKSFNQVQDFTILKFAPSIKKEIASQN